jgi:hypothetical protein
MTQYYLKFGIYNAIEAESLNTGHMQVEYLYLNESTGQLASLGVFEAMPNQMSTNKNVNLYYYLNPFSSAIDGYKGLAPLNYTGGTSSLARSPH